MIAILYYLNDRLPDGLGIEVKRQIKFVYLVLEGIQMEGGERRLEL